MRAMVMAGVRLASLFGELRHFPVFFEEDDVDRRRLPVVVQQVPGVDPDHAIQVREHFAEPGFEFLFTGQPSDDLGLQSRRVAPGARGEDAVSVAGDEQMKDVGEVLVQVLLLLDVADHLVEYSVYALDTSLRDGRDFDHYGLLEWLVVL